MIRSRATRSSMIAVATLGLVLASAPAEADQATTQTKTYLFSNTVFFFNSCASDEGIGGVRFCHLQRPGASSVRVSVEDGAGQAVSASVGFAAQANQLTVVGTPICGRALLPVPADAVELWVGTGGIWNLPIWAGHQTSCVLPPGLEGTVTAEWIVDGEAPG